ncbi:DsbA family protein [Amnibacterium flavum]|uniref:DsbA family protein n=1 Tax=Amnibacterium flavum TaxID=2173173 RepID=UPI001403BE0B|nr:thioredoxin domain-containing protein [Amnibacterium flavum]
MSTGAPGAPKPSKNERREAAREKARVLREAQQKREKRNRFLLIGGIGAVVIAAVVVVALILTTNIRPAGPGPANMASDGIKIGTGLVAETTPALPAGAEPTEPSANPANVVDIRIWVDYFCPVCGAFEAANNEQIRGWVEDGSATIDIHPIAILDNRSMGTKYSTRSANAAACVANTSPDKYFDFSQILFENQPEEQTVGLDDETLISLTEQAGVTGASTIAKCIEDQTYAKWVSDSTTRALTGPLPGTDVPKVEGTPTVIVNGVQYKGAVDDPEEFAAFVLAQSSTPEASSTPTPTPSPAATQ